jgi:hypothetical protein
VTTSLEADDVAVGIITCEVFKAHTLLEFGRLINPNRLPERDTWAGHFKFAETGEV